MVGEGGACVDVDVLEGGIGVFVGGSGVLLG